MIPLADSSNQRWKMVAKSPTKIAIVDLGEIGIHNLEEPSREAKERVAKELNAAYTSVGFVYFKNHGLSQDKIDQVFRVSQHFFCLPSAVKQKVKKLPKHHDGYIGPSEEILHDSKQELRESFTTISYLDNPYPDEDAPEFRPAIEAVIRDMVRLSHRVMKCLSIALGMEEDFLSDRHRFMMEGRDLNTTIFRTNFYPTLEGMSEEELADGRVVRIGQHADYGSITLLVQDNIGGLEVLSNGEWVSADPIPGTVLANIGLLFELISADCYPATIHRVRVPEEEIRRKTHRQSMALFVYPDCQVTCAPLAHLNMDGKPLKPAVNAREHLDAHFYKSYKFK